MSILSGPETFGQKVWRHLRTEPITKETVHRGFTALTHLVESALARPEYRVAHEYDNYGLEGVLVTEYLPRNLPKNAEKLWTPTAFIDFPTGTKLEPLYLDIPEKTRDVLRVYPEAFACMSGPTYTEWGNSYLVANNGYYFDGVSYMPFRHSPTPTEKDPHPPQRRGALSFMEDGTLRLLTDDEKWALIGGKMEGVHCMAGTSFWFTGQEGGLGHEDPGVKYLMSYLIQQEDGTMSYVASRIPVTRTHIKKLVAEHAKTHSFKGYRAVELEQERAAVHFAHAPAFSSFPYQSYGEDFTRCDHYLLTT